MIIQGHIHGDGMDEKNDSKMKELLPMPTHETVIAFLQDNSMSFS